MRTWMTAGMFAASVGALTMMSPLSASALPAIPQTAAALAGDNDLLTDVQWRRGGWGYRGGGWGYRRWYGPGIGFATGLAVGSAFAAPYYYGPPVYYAAPAPGGGAVDYCMRRFRSYDPASGTYLGYDGRRHPCP